MGVTELFSRGPALAPLAGVEARTACCREILLASNTALGAITAIREALASPAPLPAAVVQRLLATVTVQTYRMATNLGRLGGRRHRAITDRVQELTERIVAAAEIAPVLHPVAPVVPLADVGVALTESVGQANALLGEARQALGAPVPDGYIVSTAAYHAFMAHRGLGARIAAVLAGVDLGDLDGCRAASAQITALIGAAPLPPPLEQAITAATAAVPGPPRLHLALRASAVQDGGHDLPLAVQGPALLNVPRERIGEAYRRVVASKYLPEALRYRHGRGFVDAEIAICCCVLPMVETRAAGVLRVAWPAPAGGDAALHAVRGLVLAAEDASVAAEEIVLDWPSRSLERRRSLAQASLVRCRPDEGTERAPLDDDAAPVLDDHEALAVAALGWRLADALGSGVELEWALDPRGEPWVLQVRPPPDPPPAPRPRAPGSRPDPNRDRLATVADLIVPLTLRRRLASSFAPRNCHTLHDVIRFCQQATVETMFAMGDQALRAGVAARQLRSTSRIDCRIIDLGGGLHPEAGAGPVTIDDVACVPLRALWRGLTDARLAKPRLRPLSRRGFISSVASFGFDEDARVRELGEPSYAFVTREYLSLNSRVGYHFATVDARIDEAPGASYLSFRFVGGSTGVEQRSRRAALLERLLARHGFETDRQLDLVNARIRRLPPPALEDKATLIGLLLEYVNHLDMALVADAVALEYEEAFARGDLAFDRREHG